MERRKLLSINEIMSTGESGEVEFKSSLRVNLHTGSKDPRMELAVLKTIAGFLNTSGGILTIGVTDDGTALGIDADGFENEDKMSLRLVNLVNSYIGPTIMSYVHMRFEDYDGYRVMLVECPKSNTPVMSKTATRSAFISVTGRQPPT